GTTTARGGQSMIYLASPYSHTDADVRQQRFHAACLTTVALMRAGHTVFCPVVYGHPLASHGLPTDWAFWERYNREHLARCDQLVVLMLDGWKESIGVREEVRIAAELGKPVRYVNPVDATGLATLAHVATGPPD